MPNTITGLQLLNRLRISVIWRLLILFKRYSVYIQQISSIFLTILRNTNRLLAAINIKTIAIFSLYFLYFYLNYNKFKTIKENIFAIYTEIYSYYLAIYPGNYNNNHYHYVSNIISDKEFKIINFNPKNIPGN